MDSLLQPMTFVAGLAYWALTAAFLVGFRRAPPSRLRRHLLILSILTTFSGALHVAYWAFPSVHHFRWILLCFEIGLLTYLTAAAVYEARRLRMPEAPTRFKFLSDNANDTYLLLDKDSGLAYVNRVASELLGFTDDELMNKSLADLQVEFDRGKFAKLFERASEDRIAPFEISLRRKDGTLVAVELSVSRLNYRNRPYLYGVARDITERKAVEASLRNHAEELSRSNRELEQFAYVSSHDLKEPLRMVTLYVQMLQNHLGENLDLPARQYLDYALQGSRRMLALINDLLAYGRVGKELSPFRGVNTEDSLKSALLNLKSSIDESKAVITWSELPLVQGNASQLTQLLQNLIANAIKFRGELRPNIHISARRDDRGDWVFAVRDNGIGIHPRYLDRIFAIFQRLHTAQKYPGTGIGLSICKKIVENHGGTVWAESGLGQGSTFYFTLQGEPEVQQRAECLDTVTH